MSDEIAFPVLTSVLDCLCAALEEEGRPVCWCGVRPMAQIPMDHCSCDGVPGNSCGQAYVNLAAMFPVDPFPRQAIALTEQCAGVVMGVQVNAGIFRCLPGMDAHGNPPTVLQMMTATQTQMDDMRTLLRVLMCCDIPGVPAKDGRSLGRYTPVGPNGDCGGGFWTITYRKTTGTG